MLTDDDLLKLGKLLDERLKPLKAEVEELRIKINTMWDALEKRGLPLTAV